MRSSGDTICGEMWIVLECEMCMVLILCDVIDDRGVCLRRLCECPLCEVKINNMDVYLFSEEMSLPCCVVEPRWILSLAPSMQGQSVDGVVSEREDTRCAGECAFSYFLLRLSSVFLS